MDPSEASVWGHDSLALVKRKMCVDGKSFPSELSRPVLQAKRKADVKWVTRDETGAELLWEVQGPGKHTVL